MSNLHQIEFLWYQRLFLLLLLFLPALLQADDFVYRIRPGETLSGISARFLKPEITPTQLQAHNNIEKDRTIPIGTEIRIPLEWLQQAPAAAQVVFLRGEATLFRGGLESILQQGTQDLLLVGDRLLTGPSGVISIRFANGSRLLMGPKSEVTLDTLSSFGETGMIDTRLRIQRGRVESRVKPLQGSGSRYEIHTPAAVTMVRGTGFRVGVEADSGLTRNEVFEGGVAVSAAGETQEVAAGFGTLIEPGGVPAPPSRLLDPPDLSGLPAQVDAGSLKLSWQPLEEAIYYRVKLLLADQADAVLSEARVDQASHAFADLTAGSYLFQVRGIDALGLEGLNAEHGLLVNERLAETVQEPEPEPEPVPQPPLLLSPKLEPPRFGPGWMEFRWSRVADAWGYRLLLARDTDFQDPLFERIGSNPRLVIPIYWQGRLYVRVDALFKAEDQESHSGLYRIELPGR
ncbi:MAG: FecR domain-containing protein [Pseudomonadota bacterium]